MCCSSYMSVPRHAHVERTYTERPYRRTDAHAAAEAGWYVWGGVRIMTWAAGEVYWL